MYSEKVTISVVVPCYNCEETIENTVDHLTNQDGKSFQIILVDDGSTDHTGEICDAFEEKDIRIKTIHQENQGLMSAWKAGVRVSDGEYIGFCDSDDYLDQGFIIRIEDTIDKIPDTDMILFEMQLDYSRGASIISGNRIKPGIYDRKRIVEEIYPTFFSNGTMESSAVNKSRCSKVFKKDILMKVIPNLNNDISLGEDGITTFASFMIANKVICLGDYSPYHYVRTNESMIGKYDPEIFDKIEKMYFELDKLSSIYSYKYKDQILHEQLSTILIFMKKEICKNPHGFFSVRRKISNIRESQNFVNCERKCSIKNYIGGSKIFASLIIWRQYFLVYYLTRLFEGLRGRTV